jgi:uncharacterized protein YndB with AHSA1/START domain
MDADKPKGEQTTVERVSDRELVVTRVVNGPARLVFQAWTQADLMKRWWVPESFGISLVSIEIDARVGGGYKLVFAHPAGEGTMAFFGTYIEVVPGEKLVWTNEEGGDIQVTTVTFTEAGGKTNVMLHELYPSKAALDDALASGSTGAWPEQFDALDALLAG